MSTGLHFLQCQKVIGLKQKGLVDSVGGVTSIGPCRCMRSVHSFNDSCRRMKMASRVKNDSPDRNVSLLVFAVIQKV